MDSCSESDSNCLGETSFLGDFLSPSVANCGYVCVNMFVCAWLACRCNCSQHSHQVRPQPGHVGKDMVSEEPSSHYGGGRGRTGRGSRAVMQSLCNTIQRFASGRQFTSAIINSKVIKASS